VVAVNTVLRFFSDVLKSISSLAVRIGLNYRRKLIWVTKSSKKPFVSTTTAMQDICARAAAKEGAQFLAKIILARATRSLVALPN